MKRKTVLSFLIPVVFLSAVLVFLSVWWFGRSYPSFEETFRKERRIPGLGSGVSPQGLCPLPENERGYAFAMSGYLSKEPSRIYLISDDPAVSDVKEHECFVTLPLDGEPVSTHFGGIACTGEYLVVCSDSLLLRVALSDVLHASSGDAVAVHDTFETGLGNAFCYYSDGKLYAGEFYRPGNYETDASHYVDVGEGQNHALVYVFSVDESAEGGVKEPVPEKVVSVCDQVQGIAVTQEKIYLSCSYGLPDSVLRIHENPLAGEPDSSITVDGRELPLYILDPADGKREDLPCMSEEIFEKDGRLYVLFESMSIKYRYFVHWRTCRIWSASVSDLS